MSDVTGGKIKDVTVNKPILATIKEYDWWESVYGKYITVLRLFYCCCFFLSVFPDLTQPVGGK